MRVAFNLRIPAQSKLLTFAALDARAGVEWVASVCRFKVLFKCASQVLQIPCTSEHFG